MSDIGDIHTLLDEYAEAVHIAAQSGVLADFDAANAIRLKIDVALAIHPMSSCPQSTPLVPQEVGPRATQQETT